MTCEKCWAAAAVDVVGTTTSTYQRYRELLKERKDNPCSEAEQAGQFWDDERQVDTRRAALMSSLESFQTQDQ